MLCGGDEEYMLLLDIVEILSQQEERVVLLCGIGCGVVGPFGFLFVVFALVWIDYLLFCPVD